MSKVVIFPIGKKTDVVNGLPFTDVVLHEIVVWPEEDV